MRKKIVIAFMMCMLMTPAPIMAASLDDVVTQNTTNEQTVENGDDSQQYVQQEVQSNTTQGEGLGSVVDNLGMYSDMSEETEITRKITAPIAKAASIVVQVMFYILTLGLPVAVLADLGFIVIPFCRAGGAPQQAGGMQNNNIGGYGGNSYGGFGGNSYGGFGGNRFGGGYGGFGANAANMGAQAGQSDKNKFIIIPVSLEAIMIANSQMSAVDKLKAYAKDSVIKVIFTVGMGTLFITGGLSRVAIVIGEAVGHAIENAGAMM